MPIFKLVSRNEMKCYYSKPERYFYSRKANVKIWVEPQCSSGAFQSTLTTVYKYIYYVYAYIFVYVGTLYLSTWQKQVRAV